MLRFKPSHAALMLGLIVPLCAHSADFCIKVNGGFGNGGTSFVGKGFTLPVANACKPWSGFVKTGTNVIIMSTGSACRSSDGKVLELTVQSTNPSFLGTGVTSADHIKFCPTASGCSIGNPFAVGNLSGGVPSTQTCTTNIVKFPAVHN
jgi:hypothetical protein